MSLVVAAMVAVSFTIGLGAEGVFRIAQEAATQTLDQQGYMRLVLSQMGKGGGME
jgi:hypothetical protein